MRTKNIETTLRIPFYYDKPDCNGNVYPKEVILKALNNLKQNLPIVYRGNSVDSEEQLIGVTTGKEHMVTDDDKNNRYILTINGEFFYGGTDDRVNTVSNEKNIITSMKIDSIGISI